MSKKDEWLTMREAASLILYSHAWLVLHCNDSDFPRRYFVYDHRTKYFKTTEFLEYCKNHNIRIVERFNKEYE